MIVFSVFFSAMAKVPSDNVPYPIFVYVGLLFWQFFQRAPEKPAMFSSATNQSSPRSIFPASFSLSHRSHKVCGFYGCRGSTCLNDGLLRLSPHLKGLLIIPTPFDYYFYGLCRRVFCWRPLMSNIAISDTLYLFYSNSSFCYSGYLSGQHSGQIFLALVS